MSRRLVCLAVATLVTTTACAPDATAPAPAREPAPSALLVSSLYGYQATVLPLAFATGINDAGAVVGQMPDGAGVYYANGTTTLLLPLTPLQGHRVLPVGVHDNGRIIAQEVAPDGSSRALFYPGPTLSAIDIAPSLHAEPRGINRQGVVVGRFRAPGGWEAPFRWTVGSSGITDITPTGCEGGAPFDISESGFVIGYVRCEGHLREFRWNPGSSSGLTLPQGVRMTLQALEDGRVLVRYVFPPDESAIWSPTGGVSPTGPNPDVLAVAKISPNGRYVGSFEDPITGRGRAWTSIGTGGATTLPLPTGFYSAIATDVNACGTILGLGYRTSDSQPRAIVWRRSFTCDPPLVATTAF